jgi:CBS domain-containing protein
MLVKEIMTTAVRSARPEDPIREVAATMCFHKFSGLPVVDAAGKIVGVISEKDILHGMFPKFEDLVTSSGLVDFEALEHEYQNMVNLKVGDLMSQKIITVGPEMPVLKAASIMFRNRIRRIPVQQDGRLVGIISIGDVHKAIFKQNLTKLA